MVLDEQQSVREPGGFALKEDIPNVDFARNDMAIKVVGKRIAERLLHIE